MNPIKQVPNLLNPRKRTAAKATQIRIQYGKQIGQTNRIKKKTTRNRIEYDRCMSEIVKYRGRRKRGIKYQFSLSIATREGRLINLYYIL